MTSALIVALFYVVVALIGAIASLAFINGVKG